MWWRVSQEIWNWKSFKLNKFALNWINSLTFVPFTNESIKNCNNKKVEFRLCFSEMLFFIILCTVISTVDFIHLKKKSLNVPFVKLFSNFLFQGFSGVFMPFRFRPLINTYPFASLLLFYCLKMVLKLEIENSLKNNRCLGFGPSHEQVQARL